jgi:hypothetical protein
MVSNPSPGGSPEGLGFNTVEEVPFIDSVASETGDDDLANLGEEDDPPTGNESDDDESVMMDKDLGLDDEAHDSLDTVPVDLTSRAGEIVQKGQLCGVRMSVKTPEGEPLFCGYVAENCRCPKHQQKRFDAEQCVAPGVYSGVLNSTKKVIDGIVSSWISLEDRKRQAAETYQDLAGAVITSAQKRLAEDRAAQKTPSVIQFKLDEQPSEKSVPTPRQALINSWAAASESPTRNERALKPNAPGDPDDQTQTVPPDVEHLISELTTQIQTLVTQQAASQRDLLTAVQKMAITTASVPRDKPARTTRVRSSQPTTTRTQSRSAVQEPEREPVPPLTAKWYAVSKGRETGVFSSWKRVHVSIIGHPGAKFRRFKTRPEAESWLAEQFSLQGLIPPDEELSVDGDASEYNTVVNDIGGQREPSQIGLGQSVPPSTYPPNASSPHQDLVDFRMAAPDSSVGKIDEINGVSINVSTAVRSLLCPKGLTQDMQNRMMEVVPDVLAAPGKLTSSLTGEVTDPNVYDQFAEALADFADVQTQRSGGHQRDTQWKTTGRNYLAKIDSADAAVEAVTQLTAMRAELVDSLTAAFTEILITAGWTSDDAAVYCKSGGLVILVTRTLDDYCSLLLFLVYKTLHHPKNWERISKIYADHHSKKLAMIRILARRREYMLLRNYVYLRNARAVNFQSLAIVSKLTEQSLVLPDISMGGDKDKKSPKKWDCTHCHGKFHTGGSAKCDLAEYATRVARVFAKTIDARMTEAGADKDKVVADVLKDHE